MLRTLTALLLLSTAATLFSACTCSSSPDPIEVNPRTSLDPVPPPPPKTLYDEKGELKESDVVISGLRLPVGLKPFRKTKREHIFRSKEPIEKLLSYFGARLFTISVNQVGKGAVYRHASVQGAENNPTKLTVSIYSAGKKLVRVAIEEIPPPATSNMPAADFRREYQEMRKNLD